MTPFSVVVVPKHLGMPLTDAMFCPLLLARQQDPNCPAVFVLHSFCNVDFSAARSSPAAQARTAARTKKVEMERESFISCVCLGKKREREKEKKREMH